MIDYIHGDLFLSDATITNILIYDEETGTTFGNDKIYFEELQVNESISILQDLTYGSCNSCYVSLKVRSDVGNLKGKKITISLVLDDNTDEPFILGTYKVQKDNLQANEGSRVIEAFDALYDVINTDIADWYNTLYENDEAYSIAQLRHSLLEQFEIVEEEKDNFDEKELEILAVAIHPNGYYIAISDIEMIRFFHLCYKELRFYNNDQIANEPNKSNCTLLKFSNGGHILAAVNDKNIHFLSIIIL